jgi:hypothetical protein
MPKTPDELQAISFLNAFLRLGNYNKTASKEKLFRRLQSPSFTRNKGG